MNFAHIARDCGVFTKRPRRRVVAAPKFYFSDVGVVNHLAKRGRLVAGSELFGKAFENWVFHELTAANAYRDRPVDLAYWRLASGIEVDFVIGDLRVGLEAKATRKVTDSHLRGLRHLRQDHPRVTLAIVCLEPRPRRTADNIDILPVATFVANRHSEFGRHTG